LLKDKKVVVTAGPTREKIDAVRYISNYSSGKMGLALALEAHNEGADVTLIAGPVNLQIPAGIKTLHVNTAAEMLTALLQSGENADYLFMAAAIEDFVPVKSFSRKIKKNNIPAAIEIQAAPDIVTEFRQRNSRTNIVGFSVEIEQGKENSLAKLNKKGLDYIVWNNPATEGAAFGHDTNEVTVFSKQNDEWFLPKDTKRNIARKIIKIISQNRV
jgi:phosphopantothenoylcysteine decarboxylase/phosphopantothenate--cysteine ligase